MVEAGLRPDELDLLEDALEDLELEDGLDRWTEAELGPRVRERLVDYRSILAASREALPFEDVPRGVLDGVLEQARQAAVVAPTTVSGGSESWWSRLRRGFMVPALALAGTAVLVLWVFDPDDQAKLEPPPSAVEAKTVAKLEAPASEAARATPTAPMAVPDDAKHDEAADKEVVAEEAEDGLAVEAKPSADPTTNAAPTGGVMGSLGDAPGRAEASGSASQTAGGAAGPASGRWDIVSRGDRARQAGDCVAARDEYALALEDDEARVRARAFAGLGLCDAATGDDVSADANYQRARELDDGISSFIDSQNQRSRGASKKNRKAPSKKSKAAVDAFDDVADPF